MIKEMVIYPAFGIMMLTFAMQMVDVAESASEKTLLYAKDMEAAVDCATRGIDLSQCSPDLFSYDFREDINKTIEHNMILEENIKKSLQGREYSIIQQGDTLLIRVE